jgi:hypothetical protein
VDYLVDLTGTTLAYLSTLRHENIPRDVYPIGEKWKKMITFSPFFL